MNSCLTYSLTNHIIVEDYIDIDLDTSKQIFYCTKCFATFTNIDGNNAVSKDNQTNTNLSTLCSSTTNNTRNT